MKKRDSKEWTSILSWRQVHPFFYSRKWTRRWKGKGGWWAAQSQGRGPTRRPHDPGATTSRRASPSSATSTGPAGYPPVLLCRAGLSAPEPYPRDADTATGHPHFLLPVGVHGRSLHPPPSFAPLTLPCHNDVRSFIGWKPFYFSKKRAADPWRLSIILPSPFKHYNTKDHQIREHKRTFNVTSTNLSKFIRTDHDTWERVSFTPRLTRKKKYPFLSTQTWCKQKSKFPLMIWFALRSFVP